MKIKIIGIITAVALMAGMTPAKADDGRLVITTIIGAAAGGILGSQVGKGDGQLVATAAGTLIGAVIGNHIGSQTDDNYYYDEPVVYSAPRKKKKYGNNQATEVQKTVIVHKKVVKYVIVHEYEDNSWNGHKKKHKNKKWNKKKHHKKHKQVVSNCNKHNNCWKYN